MRDYRHMAAAAGLITAVLAGPAAADHQSAVVVRGKAEVPVIINGIDATGMAVFGDWGLHRAGHAGKLLEGGPLVAPRFWQRGYFPHTGRRPAYGRREIIPGPDRVLPPPAPDYYHSWSAGSDPGPVTDYPPYDPPPVILAPRWR